MYYKNGVVFNSQQAIRLDNKNTSLPSFMSDVFIASMGYMVVVDSEKPEYTEVQNILEDGIEVIDGVPTRQWKVVDMFVSMPEHTSMDGVVYPAKTKAEHEAEFYADKAEAELKALEVMYTNAVQDLLDNTALETKWDDMQSARAAAGIPLFGDETAVELAMNADAVKLARWYLKVWAYCCAQLDFIKSGQRDLPSVDAFLLELPVLNPVIIEEVV